MMRLYRVAFQAALFLLFFAASPSYSASFQVSPVRAVLNAENNSTVFEFMNTSEMEVSVQVEVMKWSQLDGQDQFENSNDFIVVPRIIKLAPGKIQVARLGLFNQLNSLQESSYRVFFTEILSAQQLEKANNISMRLRISIPVFVNPANAIKPNLQVESVSVQAEQSYLEVVNSGSQHIQLLSLHYDDDKGEALQQAVSVYLLPGQRKTVLLESSELSSLAHIKIDTDTAGMLSYDLEVLKP